MHFQLGDKLPLHILFEPEFIWDSVDDNRFDLPMPANIPDLNTPWTSRRNAGSILEIANPHGRNWAGCSSFCQANTAATEEEDKGMNQGSN